MTKLVGKTKYSIDYDIWGMPPRSGSEGNIPDLGDSYLYNNMTFLRYGDQGFVGKDTLKIDLGKSWTQDHDNPEETETPPVLGNDWGPLKLFYGQPLALEACGIDGEYPGWPQSQQIPQEDDTGWLWYQATWSEKIVISVDNLPSLGQFSKEEIEEGLHKGKIPTLDDWAAFVKLGLKAEGKTYYPIVSSPDKPNLGGSLKNLATFRDHLYKSVVPFTPKELISKQPFGKTAQVSLKTYYNTALDSKAWESFVASVGETDYYGGPEGMGSHWQYNNALPTPYGLLRVMLNKFKVENLYNYDFPQGTWAPTAFAIGTTESEDRSAFIRYPYELLMTLFGRIPQDKIAKIANIHPKTENVQAQFEEYFEGFMNAYTGGKLFAGGPYGAAADTAANYQLKKAINTIDTVFDNIAISPSVLKNLDKVNQIKKYFPYYAETEFSTEQYTELGDMIKQVLFGRYFVNKIAGYNTLSVPSSLDGPLGQPSQFIFSDYHQEKTLEDDGSAFETPTVAMNLGGVTEVQKNFYPIMRDILNYVNNVAGESYGTPDGRDVSDIQNHIAYMRDDVADPVDTNEFNSIWKKIFGTAIAIKLIKTYKKHFRDYTDLLSGKPAYTEDIAYKIEKYAKRPYEGDEKYVLSQNIIIPNTSDINLFNYVDTQLKYGTDMVYKYKIYAIKIVFGCDYKYYFLNHQAGLGTGDLAPVIAGGTATAAGWIGLNVGEFQESGNKSSGIKAFNATFGVRIFPSIVMIEDLFYESPEIIISDHPPVPPDANIVPYRGISNKILILLNGMVDTYRADPIEILSTDAANFNFIKKAQISADGKIKFSSDDPVKKFEVFRTKNKPMSYTDFELYRTISETYLEDNVKPNQKYYYTFRAIDGHGHISNPTEVYEVELIDDHGSVKPLIRIFNFEKPKYFEAIKECQKYLMIKPNLKQLYYDSEKDTIDHMFNDSDDASYKRRFKLRITSKSTGKKIDININFSKKEVDDET